MKKILIMILGLLVFGVNVYAAGDLIVNGKLGAGTSSLTAKINAESTDESAANFIINKDANLSFLNGFQILLNSNAINATSTGLVVIPAATATDATSGAIQGSIYKIRLAGSGTISAAYGFSNQVHLASSVGSYTVDTAKAAEFVLWHASNDTNDHTLTNYYGVHSRGMDYSETGSLSGTDWRHAYYENFPDFGGTVANVAGLWIDKQTYGMNNYGIVLNGDGEGADIVFGASQQASIYSSSGLLYATDKNGNITQFSPHDPETGEWIYYSKNTKTGVVKRVNMEKLVKAVERLTGETFMVETLMEDK
jgi:hypothetical protein